MTEQSLSPDSLTEGSFELLVDQVFDRISLLGRWTEQPSWGSQNFSSDEVLMFRLGQYFFVLGECDVN